MSAVIAAHARLARAIEHFPSPSAEVVFKRWMQGQPGSAQARADLIEQCLTEAMRVQQHPTVMKFAKFLDSSDVAQWVKPRIHEHTSPNEARGVGCRRVAEANQIDIAARARLTPSVRTIENRDLRAEARAELRDEIVFGKHRGSIPGEAGSACSLRVHFEALKSGGGAWRWRAQPATDASSSAAG